MLIRFLMIIILMICFYKGLEHFGIINDKVVESPQTKEFKRLLNDWDKPKTTNQIKGKIVNINTPTEEDLKETRREKLVSKMPDISIVFSSNNQEWISVLQEEDFTMLRELNDKVNNVKLNVSEEDLKFLKILEDKGILSAIKNKNPKSLNKESIINNSSVENETPAYEDDYKENYPADSYNEYEDNYGQERTADDVDFVDRDEPRTLQAAPFRRDNRVEKSLDEASDSFRDLENNIEENYDNYEDNY